MGLRDVPAEGEHQADGVLRGGDRIRLGGVGDHDPALGRGVDVDVVDAGPGSADHLESLGSLDQVGGELGRRANQDAVELADSLLKNVAVPVKAELDVELLPQKLDARVGDLLSDEDLHRLMSSVFSRAQSMEAVRASTSAGSTAGNMPILSWLRPSFR